jgi:hypothetical protein
LNPGPLAVEANIKSYHPTKVVVRLGAGVTEDDRRVRRIVEFAKAVKQTASFELDYVFSRATDKNPAPQNLPVGTRIVMLGERDEWVQSLAANPDFTIFDDPIVIDGLATGLLFLRERATSITTHRHGNTFTLKA